jgi:RimJ/RimL family protein N-acetyltransferase
MHLFLDVEDRLVGSGGYVGPPDDGVVELGYEIAPEFRRKGYATAAVGAMVAKAKSSGAVHTVIAHTLAAENPSTAVLRKAGFRFLGAFPDEEQGSVWRWELALE